MVAFVSCIALHTLSLTVSTQASRRLLIVSEAFWAYTWVIAVSGAEKHRVDVMEYSIDEITAALHGSEFEDVLHSPQHISLLTLRSMVRSST